MPNAAPGAATILDYSEMRRPSINNSCNKVIVIKLDKLYYSKPKLYYDKPKLFNNNMPPIAESRPRRRRSVAVGVRASGTSPGFHRDRGRRPSWPASFFLLWCRIMPVSSSTAVRMGHQDHVRCPNTCTGGLSSIRPIRLRRGKSGTRLQFQTPT